MSIFFKPAWYITSFWPLWISIAFIDIISLINNSANPYTEIIGLTIILLTNIFSIVVLVCGLNAKENYNEELLIISANEEKAITAEFLLTYIMPLFAFDFTSWKSVILFLIFYLSVLFLMVRHSYMQVNIFLELLGYRIYKCELTQDINGNSCNEKQLISKVKLTLEKGKIINIKWLNNDLGIS